ncbi:alpha-amylase family glycosyl hydrolase [Caloranaerobacter sp. TR13]|uniref:alpha-amylase family glycosyl hydrolase n=1 Tax=Caloranaerobacter sp. TR13 TaxID=1302151 RepID=UPI0006D43539|nr:alpha-amylase family glycosyl hydrolase [Caloranaerobacter sp. TR13]
MPKKLIIFFIIFTLIFSVGCQNQNNIIDTKQQIENIKEDTKSNNSNEIKYKVQNNGGTFSSKDIIYFIMTDRFYDGNKENNNFPDVNKNNPKAYHGGDLRGIIEKLDYIKSLGVTAIWITPVFKNEYGGYHGYWINDFYKVDPHLGTLNDLKELVQEAHKRDIKIILDYVVNHTGYKSPWLKDEKYKDWFHPKKNISNWNDQKQLEEGWIFGLPDLDQDNPEVKKYFIDNALWWIEQTGIDGLRLDTVKHVPKSFWNEFAYKIKSKYPNFFLLGEVWHDNPRYLEQYHELGIDSLTNYPLYTGLRKTFTRFGKANSLVNAIKRQSAFTNPELNGIFVDNHDNRRLVTEAKENGKAYLKQALTFIMTYPGIPIIYYGTEIAMQGGDDPDNRRDMEWDKIDNSEMLSYFKKLTSLRNSNEALYNGDFELLNYDSYFLSYIRKKGNSKFIIIYNLQTKEKDVTINLKDNNSSYTDVFNNKTYHSKNGSLNITLKPLEVIILTSN